MLSFFSYLLSKCEKEGRHCAKCQVAHVPVDSEEHTVVSRAVWGSEDMQGAALPGHALSSPSESFKVVVL